MADKLERIGYSHDQIKEILVIAVTGFTKMGLELGISDGVFEIDGEHDLLDIDEAVKGMVDTMYKEDGK